MRKSKTTNAIYVGKTCEKHLSSEHYLKTHIKVIHEKIKDYKCEMCEKDFYYSVGLKQHVKQIHGKITVVSNLLPRSKL